MADLRLARAARSDIQGIRGYSKAAFGAPVALAYIDGLRAIFALLGDRPLAGSAEDDLGDGVRSFAYRSHRLYYRHAEGIVLVIRILHHAQDARSILTRPQ